MSPLLDRRTVLAGLASVAATDLLARTPRSAFGPLATAEEVTQGLDLRGKTVVVTGCTAGLGFESMRVFALRGAHVIGTGRTLEQGREACARVGGSTTPVALELADFQSVVDCANRIRTRAPHIDVLMLNAGIALDRFEQVDGLEKHFVVNHLGHFILANRLMDLVRAKLANGLFSLELARRLAGTKATSNCLTPGPVHTDIFNSWSTPVEREAKTPAQGAATQCYVATSPALAQVTGEYFRDCNPADQSEHQRDAAMAAKLWHASTELTRKYL